jgi:twinkle protein
MSPVSERPLNPAALAVLEKRGIDPEVATRMGVYTARRAPKSNDPDADKEPIPDVKGNVLCYPYLDIEGVEINAKFTVRNKDGKMYWQRPGKPKTLYNYPVLADPALHTGSAALLIVEGENDCLAGLTAGHPWSTSVPAGGDPAFDKHGKPIPMKPDDELDPTSDVKFEYIVNCWDELSKVKRIVLWTDWDSVGERLKIELSRRLGKIRCSTVPQPPDIAAAHVVAFTKKDQDGNVLEEGMRACKDLNEVLLHFGAERVRAMIENARPMPVSGLYRLSDFEEVERIHYSTGFAALDPLIKLYDGSFTVSSGLPMSGKSQFWNQVAFNMAHLHGWRIALCPFEADVKPDIIRQLRAFFLWKNYRTWSAEDKANADAWIEKHFVFITRDPQGLEDTLCTVEWLCEKIEDAVIRYGINMAVIDPWNQVDHQRRPGERGDEYLTRSIKFVKDTGKRLRISTVIVAHPDKSAGKESLKEGKVMTLYDMADGAAWNNAAELGVIVYRKSMKDTLTRIVLRKVKFRGTGEVGDAYLQFLNDLELFDPALTIATDALDAQPH